MPISVYRHFGSSNVLAPEAYLAAGLKPMDEITAVQAALSSGNRVFSGPVHIDMPVAFGRRVLLPAFIEIARPHPGLSPHPTFTDATRYLHDDVGNAVRFGALENTSHLVVRHLVTQAFVTCTAPAYLRAFGKPLRPEDIAAHQCVGGRAKDAPLVWFLKEDGLEKRLKPPAAHRVSNGEAMVDAIVGGLGIDRFPISLVRAQLEDGRLEPVLESYSPAVSNFSCYGPNEHNSVHGYVTSLMSCLPARPGGRFAWKREEVPGCIRGIRGSYTAPSRFDSF